MPITLAPPGTPGKAPVRPGATGTVNARAGSDGASVAGASVIDVPTAGTAAGPTRASRRSASDEPSGARVKASGSVTTSVPPARTQASSASANGRSSVSPRGSHTVRACARRPGSATRRVSASNENVDCASSPSTE